MNKRKIIISAMLAVLAIIAALLAYRLYYERSTVVFVDENLATLISEVLETPSEEITVADMKQIIELDATGREIRWLDGLQHATEIVSIELEDNFVEDVSPLARLTRLETLGLRNNGIIDLDAVNFRSLRRIPSLTNLNLRNNVLRPDPENSNYQYRLQDIGILADFPRLEVLELRDNHIEDLSPLSALTRLTFLDISQNPIRNGDITFIEGLLNLQYLNLRECNVHDLSPVTGLRHLTYLNLHSNDGIMTLQPLESLTGLETLILRHVPITGEMDVLGGMTQLRRLNLRNTGVRDVTVLAGLMAGGALQDDTVAGTAAELDLRDNPIPVEPEGFHEDYGYAPIRDYWDHIGIRYPDELPRPATQQIIINEMMSSNGSTIADASGEYHDWIELFNPADESIDLSGWYFSDDSNDPRRWKFPEGIIISGRETLLIWASGQDRRLLQQELHTNFSISRTGEPVLLTASDGETLVDYLPPVRLGRDQSYGRLPDDPLDLRYFDVPTPTHENPETGLSARVEIPRFSHPSGFYTESFTLQTFVRDPETILYYTVDGTDPVEQGIPLESSLTIEETPAFISSLWQHTTSHGMWLDHESWPGFETVDAPNEPEFRATTIRARGFKEGRWSDETIQIFFVHPQGAGRYTLPVISLVADPAHFFNYRTGIYVPGIHHNAESNRPDETGNYFESGIEWERPVHMTYFEPSGRVGFSQHAGVRIHGGWTRRFLQKSLRLYPRADYDEQNTIEFELFPNLRGTGTGEPITSFNRILLRNSGNDWLSTLIRDAMMHQMVPMDQRMNVQAYAPVIVFLNGEYWGIHNMRERMDADYLASHYGFNTDQVTILENNRVLDHGIEQDVADYEAMLKLIYPEFEADRYPTVATLQDEAVLNQIAQMMDIDHFIDYYITQIYFDNTDWPANNVKVWRLRTDGYLPDAPYGHDGRWRWLLFDTDYGFGLHTPGDASFNTLENALIEDGTDWHNRPWSTFLMRSLLQNERIRNQFINRFEELLNTTFHPDQIIPVIEAVAARIEPEIEEQINRWGYPGGSVEQWRENVASMKQFAIDRPAHVREHLTDYFQP
jgi:Leucine-rich repeat (LRR) protein